MKTIGFITTVFLSSINFADAQMADTNTVPSLPRARAYGISGPGAKHTVAWTNYDLRCTGAAVKNGLIPNLKPLIPDTQLRNTIVILGGDGNYHLTGSSGADIRDFDDGSELCARRIWCGKNKIFPSRS